MRALHTGALILLNHFHYVNKGDLPFSLALEPSMLKVLAQDAGLTDKQAAFVRITAILVKERGK